MKYWLTEIEAIDPVTRTLKTWCGPNVPGMTRESAEAFIQNHGLGYCKIIGEFVGELGFEHDINDFFDAEKARLN